MHNWNNNIRLLLFCLCFFFSLYFNNNTLNVDSCWREMYFPRWPQGLSCCWRICSSQRQRAGAAVHTDSTQVYTHMHTGGPSVKCPWSKITAAEVRTLGGWVDGWLTNPSNRGRRPITCQRGGLHRRLNSRQNIDSLFVKDCNSPVRWCTHLKINKDVKIDHELAVVHWVRQLSQCAIWVFTIMLIPVVFRTMYIHH